jgi:Ca-activated chloride channel family protein
MKHEPATLKSTSGQAMPLEGVVARGTVTGLLLELDVEQRYRNSGETSVEVVYTFPMPFDAVLLDLDVELGGRKLSAVVVEKRVAETRYEDAIDKGDTAIMLERAGDGLCTLNLGNLMAGERAIIRYRYAELLRFQHGAVRLCVPTVIAPRYGDASKAGLEPHQLPGSDLAVEYPLALTIELRGDIATGTFSSPSHAIATSRTDASVLVSLAGGAFLDRDFVLNVGGLSGRSLAVVAEDGERFVALASFCAAAPRDANALPLNVKLLVDCSGSMGGDSIDAARRALHRVLAALEPSDHFAFSRFGSQLVHETAGLLLADATNVRLASESVGRMDADLGGTEMPAALRGAFAIDGAADVLLITDGEIWDADGLVAEARAARQRVFVVGIGAAPAEGVLKRLADASGGACEFVAPDEDAEAAIVRMFARLRAPRVEAVAIDWPATPAWTTPLPGALFGGETIHAFAAFGQPSSGGVTLTLTPAGDARPMTATVHLADAAVAGRTLARFAAARRIETAAADEQLQLALGYGLLTSRTNLLVVHERAAGEKAMDLPELAKVAQMHAAGWHGAGSVHAGVRRKVAMPSLNYSASFELARDALSCRDLESTYFVGSRDDMDLTGILEIFESSPVERSASRETSLAAFIGALDRAGAAHVPVTLADLEGAGLPHELVEALAALVSSGQAERDVVRAVLEAIATLAADRTITTRISRQLARVCRHQFQAADECRSLRDEVTGIVRDACRHH